MHSRDEIHEVLRLVGDGLNDCEISRATRINRTTVRDWRNGRVPRTHRTDSRVPRECPRCHGAPLDEPAYAYVLGAYLGDGCISRHRRTFRLRLVQDQRYPELITLWARSIARVRGDGATIGRVARIGCIEVGSYWNHWPCLFPQHGSGAKHQRPIVLAEWQRRIVHAYPRQFLRGLIHSDGCRVTNRVWNGKYEYPRYFFTNSSGDILQLFRDACDAVGVPHRTSKWNTISIARREGVAALDAFIGPNA